MEPNGPKMISNNLINKPLAVVQEVFVLEHPTKNHPLFLIRDQIRVAGLKPVTKKKIKIRFFMKI